MRDNICALRWIWTHVEKRKKSPKKYKWIIYTFIIISKNAQNTKIIYFVALLNLLSILKFSTIIQFQKIIFQQKKRILLIKNFWQGTTFLSFFQTREKIRARISIKSILDSIHSLDNSSVKTRLDTRHLEHISKYCYSQ